ncbi:hypothetical protein ABZP36_034550 [Zizania latifolia]
MGRKGNGSTRSTRTGRRRSGCWTSGLLETGVGRYVASVDCGDWNFWGWPRSSQLTAPFNPTFNCCANKLLEPKGFVSDTGFLSYELTFADFFLSVVLAKVPDIEKCLEIVATLQAKKALGEALTADFELSEGIYSRAKIEDTDSVCLWLGANIMLEYSCDEANALLKKNLENAKASLEVLVADLQFLRDQQTITQVTIARVFNWDVHQRRSKQVTKET